VTAKEWAKPAAMHITLSWKNGSEKGIDSKGDTGRIVCSLIKSSLAFEGGEIDVRPFFKSSLFLKGVENITTPLDESPFTP
jgi:hypothetical protein